MISERQGGVNRGDAIEGDRGMRAPCVVRAVAYRSVLVLLRGVMALAMGAVTFSWKVSFVVKVPQVISSRPKKGRQRRPIR